MAQLIENNEAFFTPFEPKVANRFILEMDGVPSFLCKKVTRPSLDCGEVVLDHMNIQRKLKGKCKWGDITMVLYDAIVPSGAQAVMKWMRTAHESVTGRDGYADTYKKDFNMHGLGPVLDKVDNFKVKGAYIKTLTFGEYDWSVETPVEVTVTMAMDLCVLEY